MNTNKQDKAKKGNKNIRNMLIWGILGLFIISGMLQGNLFGINNPVVAHVGKQKIRVSDVRVFMNFIQIPEGADRSQPNVQHYIFTKALDIAVQRALITQECKRLKFVVSDKKVIETIKKDVQFHENGQFSRSKFLAQLGKLGFSEMQYKMVQRENLLHRQWLFLLESAYTIPEHVSEAVARSTQQKRSGRYMEVQHSSIKMPKLSDAQLAKFFQENIGYFKEDRQRIFTVVEFANVKSVDDIDFMLSGQKFDKAIKKFNGRVYNFENMPEQLRQEIEGIVASLPEYAVGQNSPLYVFNNKYYAFRLEKIVPAHTPIFAEIKDKVRKKYQEQYIKNNVKPNGKWVRLVDLKLGENYLGLPDFIVNALFLNKVGGMRKIEQPGATYFVITENITNGKVSQENKKLARDYVSSVMLTDVIFASMNSLRLRNNIVSR